MGNQTGKFPILIFIIYYNFLGNTFLWLVCDIYYQRQRVGI